MDYASLLSVLSNWAAILTAVIAVMAYVQFVVFQWVRRRRLEAYLRTVQNEGRGQKTVLHLMRNLRMTEAEVLAAGLRSKKVDPVVKPNEDGLADKLLFVYVGEG